jgi:hypothetical protein
MPCDLVGATFIIRVEVRGVGMLSAHTEIEGFRPSEKEDSPK